MKHLPAALAAVLVALITATDASAAMSNAAAIQNINKVCAPKRAAVARFARSRGGDDSYLDRILNNLVGISADKLTKMKANPPKPAGEQTQQEIDFLMCAIGQRLTQLHGG